MVLSVTLTANRDNASAMCVVLVDADSAVWVGDGAAGGLVVGPETGSLSLPPSPDILLTAVAKNCEEFLLEMRFVGSLVQLTTGANFTGYQATALGMVVG